MIHQRGMGQALGLGEGGSRLPRFVNGKAMSKYIGPELRLKLQNPIVFQGLSVGQGGAPSRVYGYDVTLLIDLCKAVVLAETDGALMHHLTIRPVEVVNHSGADVVAAAGKHQLGLDGGFEQIAVKAEPSAVR